MNITNTNELVENLIKRSQIRYKLFSESSSINDEFYILDEIAVKQLKESVDKFLSTGDSVFVNEASIKQLSSKAINRIKPVVKELGRKIAVLSKHVFYFGLSQYYKLMLKMAQKKNLKLQNSLIAGKKYAEVEPGGKTILGKKKKIVYVQPLDINSAEYKIYAKQMDKQRQVLQKVQNKLEELRQKKSKLKFRKDKPIDTGRVSTSRALVTAT